MCFVALFTGAWIETRGDFERCSGVKKSRSLRARGLKPCWFFLISAKIKVALFTGAWIETKKINKFPFRFFMSRSLRARGLKPWIGDALGTAGSSRSLRARGLKHNQELIWTGDEEVALFTGAWIET